MPRPGGFVCGFASYLFGTWLGADLRSLFLPPLLFVCRMARGQEGTSTSQAGRSRGPTLGTPSTSSIVSSLSMEELRTYYEIPDAINLELMEGPAVSTQGDKHNAVFFTRKQLVAGL